MNILEMFQKRLEDFESVTKAVEGKDSDETFEWQMLSGIIWKN